MGPEGKTRFWGGTASECRVTVYLLWVSGQSISFALHKIDGVVHAVQGWGAHSAGAGGHAVQGWGECSAGGMQCRGGAVICRFGVCAPVWSAPGEEPADFFQRSSVRR